MSVSAAELPHMSGALGSDQEVAEALRARLDPGLRQIAFFVLPSVVAFLVFGDVIVGAVYQTGRFTHADALYVWGILAGATVGLLASTLGPALFVRLLRAARYAHAAAIRHRARDADHHSRLFLRDSASASCWDRRALGRRGAHGVCGDRVLGGIHAVAPRLNRRIGRTGISQKYLAKLWVVASVAAAVGMAIRHFFQAAIRPIPVGLVVLVPYGAIYLGVALAT